MKKRLKFQCWNCPKTYFETIEITDTQKAIIYCPNPSCRAEAVVDLRPYHMRNNTLTLVRGENKETQSDEGFQFPDVLPTRKSD